jgi:hypothetical protein
MFVSGSAARLRGWTSTGMAMVFLIAIVAAVVTVVTVVFVIRSTRSRAAAQRHGVPPSKPE